MASKTHKSRFKKRVTSKQIADEIRRMGVTDRIYSADYVSRVRSGYAHSIELKKLIDQAVSVLDPVNA